MEPALLKIDGVQRVDLRSQRDGLVLINFDAYRAAALGELRRLHGTASPTVSSATQRPCRTAFSFSTNLGARTRRQSCTPKWLSPGIATGCYPLIT